MSIEHSQAQRRVEEFFIGVLNNDTAVLKLMAKSTGCVRLENNEFEFDLPSLYPLIFPQKTLSYAEFKAVLYGGDLNRKLTNKGAMVVLSSSVSNSNKAAVDVNRYCLQWNK